ncbi:S8 family peptidase [Thermosyntropha sp.]|uniref:S8 family peptidase n=1 Tax=Thermosyntropha sp. TaxID=2740820 RepID=UPI0025D72FB8|nr:S8 family peptidase [Thermosyntropha sp.]MBO8158914.1 S8 family peptidase [Thermosyntropha sp.]
MRMVNSDIKGIYRTTLSDKPWIPPGVALIAAQRMWPVTRGEKTVVAVIDTGIDYTHPDLKSNVVGGMSFVPREKDYMDENGHGTHVAGTIAANGKILGVAPETKILAIKVLNKYGAGSLNAVVQGLTWARKWKGQKGEKVNVINMSLGSMLPYAALHKEIIKAVNDGITIVCAAGNEGDSKPDTIEISYPAFYSETLAVGAVDLYSGIASFSNSNPRVDIVAPGIDTYSTYPKGRYVKLSGTSMAAPHIAGAVALIYSRYMLRFEHYPVPQYIKELLHYQAIDLGEAGFDFSYGYGLFSFNIDGGKAVRIKIGEKKYFINKKQYEFEMAPFMKGEKPVALIEEIARLLSAETVFISSDNSGEGHKGEVEIWV